MPERVAVVLKALTELDVRPGERVLIMLPVGPGFIEAFTVITQQGGLPLPAKPLVAAQDIAPVAVEADARLVLVSADRICTLVDLDAEPPLLVDGPQGPWVAALRLR